MAVSNPSEYSVQDTSSLTGLAQLNKNDTCSNFIGTHTCGSATAGMSHGFLEE